MSIVIAVMSRAPSGPGKTRLSRSLGVSELNGLTTCLLLDTFRAASNVRGADPVILYSPPEAEGEFASLLPGVRRMPQRGGSLGERMHAAFLDLFAEHAPAVAIIGSDLPTLPPAHVRMAVRALGEGGDPVVLGPGADGGYYLIGLKRLHPELFDGIEWGTETVLERTLDIAAQTGLTVSLLPPWHDVDTAEDLKRVWRHASSASGRLTRRWLAGAAPEIRERLGVYGRRAPVSGRRV